MKHFLAGAPNYAAGSWTPADISTLHGWWDADDASTFTYSSGTLVSTWADKSGNGYTLTTGAGTPNRNGTINGNTSVVFDGDDSLGITSAFTALSKPYTILVVARNTSATGAQRTAIITNGGGVDGRVFHTSGGTIDIYQGAFLSTSASWGTTNAHSIAAVFNGGSSKIAYDSNSYTTGTAGTASFGTGWYVGSYNGSTQEFWIGDICEIVTLTGEISSGDLASWWGYTSTKWGTP